MSSSSNYASSAETLDLRYEAVKCERGVRAAIRVTESEKPSKGRLMSTQEETQSENRKNKAKSSQVPSVKAHWDAKSNEIFIKLCVEQVKVGHRPGTHLDRVGWENVITTFKTMTGKAYQRIQMKNHWDVLKKDWLLWNNLLRGETGLGRDTLAGAISASDEWWTKKLERYPNAAKFRRMPLQFSEALDILFLDAAITGE
ncbi:L10-interacting MYB domain-containing protein-like [Camellia sinensis]|uniref:L10-interacting MYB domain-containing protein-like n=1 Tax=Camellia sinensis TaxID=4442 RepID=UPI0010362F1A|nr:L10-interacting MYB domain-containing protein-like [Camellia sinensis]